MTAELPKLPETELRSIAESLFKAHVEGSPVAPPSSARGMGAADAKAVRRMLRDRHEASGRKHEGYKVGFTSKPIQEALGVHEPEFGFLFDDYLVPAAEPVRISRFCETYAEPEIAFRLAKDLAGPASIQDVLDATEWVCPAIEIVDSRTGLAASKVPDMVADNVLAAGVALSPNRFGPRERALDSLPVRIETGTETCEGATSNVLGHPAASVAWLAGRLSEGGCLDGALRAGHIIMSGSATKYAAIAPGERLRTDFGDFGSIELEFA